MANESDSNVPIPNNNRQRGRVWLILLSLVLVSGAAVGYRYYQRSLHYEWTDDAFIRVTVTTVSPRVAGQVVNVAVEDNQAVRAGDLLVEIDSRPLEAQLAEVKASGDLSRAKRETAELNVSLTKDSTGASVEDAEAQTRAANSAVLEATANVKAAEAQAEWAVMDARRLQNLLARNAASQQQYDAAATARQVAEARVTEAKKKLSGAMSDLDAATARLARAKTAPQQVAVSQSQVKQYDAELAQSEASSKRLQLDLSFTKLFAPHDGRVTTKSVHKGEYVQVGQPLMALVASDPYVVANFKETQLTYMRFQQPVDVTVDAFPGVKLKGHVDSIQSGTGAEFSLLPAQNATGNYVKVVQRVPVKIVFDQAIPDGVSLVSGMSVVPEVRVR